MSASGAAARRIGVLSAVIEEARRRARRRRLAYGALLGVALVGVGLLAALGEGGPGAGSGGGAAKTVGAPGPAQVLRTIEAPPGDVRWTLVGSGRCYELAVEEIGGSDQGGLSGACARKSPFSYSTGGIEVGGQWYSVINGTAGRKAREVRVSLADGTTRAERIVDGAWLVVVPGPDPVKENSFDMTQIETLDPSGAVLASARPDSIKALYERIGRLNRAPTH